MLNSDLTEQPKPYLFDPDSGLVVLFYFSSYSSENGFVSYEIDQI